MENDSRQIADAVRVGPERLALSADVAGADFRKVGGVGANSSHRCIPASMCHPINTPMHGVMGTLDLLLESGLTAAQRELAMMAQTSAGKLETLFNNMLELPDEATPASPAAGAMSGVRLLFVDEQASSRNALERDLARHEIRAEGFAGANEALSALEGAVATKDPFRIAILDRQMPGIDGETLGAALKSDPAFDSLLLLLLTASFRASDAERFAQAGFSALLDKPIQNPLLIEAVSILCNALQSGQTAPFVTKASLGGGSGENPRPLIGYRILVVDDDCVNQRVAVRMLENFGCQSESVSSGQAALSRLTASQFDLVLMDCQMPEIDGFQATDLIRRAENGLPRTPIIGWTACALADVRARGMAAGMDDMIPKLIRPPQLKATLKRWLKPLAAPSPDPIGRGDELDAMRKMFGADFAELANLFQTDSPPRINALFLATAESDAVKVAKFAHALSGSSSSIGAAALAALCKKLEISAKSSMPIDIMARLVAIETEYARIAFRLRSMVG